MHWISSINWGFILSKTGVIGRTKNGEQYGLQRKLLKMIKEACDQHDIEIPYPHQVNVVKRAE